MLHRRDAEIKTDAEREGHGDKTLAASITDLSMTSVPIPLSALAALCSLRLRGERPIFTFQRTGDCQCNSCKYRPNTGKQGAGSSE